MLGKKICNFTYVTISKLKQWNFRGESFGQGLFAPLSSTLQPLPPLLFRCLRNQVAVLCFSVAARKANGSDSADYAL